MKRHNFAISPVSLSLLSVYCLLTPGHAADSLARNWRPLTEAEKKRFGPASGAYRYDPAMIRASEIASRRAHARTTWHCWKFVKDALVEANAVSSRPKSAWAKQAGEELCGNYGFVALAIRDPLQAPVGAVIVYGGADAGHVELRTTKGFVSDFSSPTPYPRPLLGIYVKRAG